MKRTILFCLATISIISFGCEDNESETQEMPETYDKPTDLKLDLNQDGTTDFSIIYSQRTVGYPTSPGNAEQVRGKLVSAGDNQILKNENDILFLNDVNLIEDNTFQPFNWDKCLDEPVNTIVLISQYLDGETWPEEWRILSEEIKDSYLIGFKLVDANSSNLGFMEITIDSQNGQIELLNTEFL